MFSHISPEARVPQDHSFRTIRRLVDRMLTKLSPDFDALYAKVGRPSVPSKKLLRALPLQVLYTVRSRWQLMQHLGYRLLFRWFVRLNMGDPVWKTTTFSKNRERLLHGEIAQLFFAQVLVKARPLLSDEHFNVDSTLIEAWASLKRFRRKEDRETSPPDGPGNPSVNSRGETYRNTTHASTTDPQARLY